MNAPVANSAAAVKKYRYDFSVGMNIVNGQTGEKFMTVKEVTWHGIDQDALGGMTGLALAVEAEVKRGSKSKEKGPYVVTMTANITPLDGGPVPVASGKPQTFTDFTKHDISDVQEAMLKVGTQLVTWGRGNAEAKEGRRK